MKNDWSKLNSIQLGRYAEYFTKMEFTKAGFDVFTSEVDDKGIDFIIRKNENDYFDLQNKSIRFPRTKYVFMSKIKFQPRRNLILALVIFEQNKEQTLLLIPSLDWIKKSHPALKERNYVGKKSKPEWGLDITKSNIDELKQIYNFNEQIIRI